MDFEKDKSYFGFRIIESQQVEDINSMCYVFVHEKSGAKLFYAKNDDNNKVFFVSFKTPPTDDCGTAHILEHSVLCGSKKYPAKDPFNELMKGSLNTYLNAMTFSDKTMYPIASCNNEDFKNLMDVYLDAVFNPVVLKEEKIFKQEGWHYELEEKDSPVTINGVVYNEMKGAMSSPERVLNNAINKSLFKDSIYKFESGGDPDAIPKLTYENFIDFYNKYYHPSNSFFYLYGNMNIEECLKHINDEYLSNYDDRKEEIIIHEETSQSKSSLLSDTFSVPVGTKTDNESLLSLNFIVGKSTDTLLSISMEILSYVLLATGASPLKKVLIEKRIAETAEGWFDSSSYEMVFSVVAKNSSCRKIGLFKDTVINTLEKIVEEGLDKELILSAVNFYEFMLREEDYGYRPKGLVYGIEMMKGWLHGQNPLEAVKIYEHLKTIRDGIDKRYFENIISEKLLKNKECSLTGVAAEEGKQEKTEENTKAWLENLKSSMSDEEIEKLITETSNLKKYQSEPDSQEVIEKIPVLRKEDIDKKADFDVFEENENIIYIPQNTNGIIYNRLVFSFEAVERQLIPYAGLLGRALGKLDTEKYSFEKLPTKINMHTGGINARATVYGAKESMKPVIVVRAKALERNIDELYDILNEIIFKTDFLKEESVRKILLDLKAEYQRNYDNNGHLAAIRRSGYMLDKEGFYLELIDGIEFSDMIINAVEDVPGVCEKLLEVSKQIFTKENLISFISCDRENAEKNRKYIEEIRRKLPSVSVVKADFDFVKTAKSEAIETGGKVVYNARVGDFEVSGFKFSGKMNVITNIINTEFLWNVVRVKGGAYGCGCSFQRGGRMIFYSYRDPNIKSTLDAFSDAADFLEEIKLSERDLTKHTLGAINSIDKPKSKTERVEMAVSRYFLGLTKEDIQKSRDELLCVTEEDVKEFSGVIRKVMEESVFVTFGSELKIREEQNIYETVRSLYKK